MLIESFNETMDNWINALDQYNEGELFLKPVPTGWALGQVYMHLLQSTFHFMEQIELCLNTDTNIDQEASPAAKTMFRNNEFPNKILEGPPQNAYTPLPVDKQQILTGMLELKEKMNILYKRILSSGYKGKTKHPGLNYFSAMEWFQFARMHLRHHLRQKKRIDEFLKGRKGRF